MVEEGDLHLAAVVAVDNTHLICGGKPLLCGKPAARVNEARVAHGEFERNAGRDYGRLPRAYLHVPVEAGIQVCARGIHTAVYGYFCVAAQFFDADIHYFHSR